MKAFDLEKAKAGEPVVCRDGSPARIICFDRLHDRYNIVALVTTYWHTKKSLLRALRFTVRMEDTALMAYPLNLI